MTEHRSSRKRIAQLLYSGLGGHGGVAFGLTDADLSDNWEWTLGFLGIEPLLPDFASRCTFQKIDYRYIKAVPRRPWRSYRPVYRWLRDIRPDIIVLHSLSAILPVRIYSWLNRVPLIAVEHQNNELKSRQEWLFSWLAMQTADAVVLLTARYREELIERFGKLFRPRKVRLIANGIDTSSFGGGSPLSDQSKSIVKIGMAARFSAIKRFDVLIDMLRILQIRRADIDWRLSFAGSGERWHEVHELAERGGISAGLTFEGMLSGAALADWYRGLDIYCHASDGETLSVSILQAMAAGLPIVGSDVEGINNLLSGNPSLGIIVNQQSGTSFSDAIEAIISQPEEARAMAHRAQRAAAQFYSRDRMFESYSFLANELLTR